MMYLSAVYNIHNYGHGAGVHTYNIAASHIKNQMESLNLQDKHHNIITQRKSKHHKLS